MKKSAFFCLVGFIFHLNLCQAKSLLQETPIPVDEDLGWMVPNEVYPIHGKPIFEKNNGGVYVGVGTERGFMGAILAHASRLLLLDKTPSVVRFNRLNIDLLKLSVDREDYFNLRTNPVALKLRVESLVEQDSLKTFFNQENNLEWWIKNVSRDEDFDIFHYPQRVFDEYLATHPKQINAELKPFFTGSNYLHNDDMFAEIRKLAKYELIESHQIDLKHVDAGWVEQLNQALLNSGEKIGIIDISNVHDSDYLGTAGVIRLMGLWVPSLENDAIILQTFQGEDRWSYHGWHVGFLRKEGIAHVLRTFFNHFKRNPKYRNVEHTFNFLGRKRLEHSKSF